MRRPSSSAAFTLIELLLVVLVLAIILAVSAPAVDGALRSSRLTAAGDEVRNYLSAAQQTAVSQSVEVEVRIFRQLDPYAGDTSPRSRLLRTYALRPVNGGDAEYKPVGSPLRLGDSLAFSTVPKFSSLLGRSFLADREEAEGVGASYVSFHFFPDGSTDLPPSQPWFLTLMEEKHVTSTDTPSNFVTIQVLPSSGKLRTFRP